MIDRVHTQIIESFYHELWNKWQFNLAERFLHPEINFRGSLGNTTKGIPGFESYFNLIRKSFPDFHNRIDRIISQDNQSTVQLTFSGTQKGPVLGYLPTGQFIQYPGIAIFTFDQSIVTDIWVIGDVYGLLKQIGAIDEMDH